MTGYAPTHFDEEKDLPVMFSDAEVVDLYLKRFPGPIVMKPKSANFGVAIGGSLLFIYIGIFLSLFLFGDTNGLGNWQEFFLTWGFMAIGFLGICVAIYSRRTGGPWITLNTMGFEVKSLFCRPRKWHWKEVSNFRVVSIPQLIYVQQQSFITFDDVAKTSRWKKSFSGIPGTATEEQLVEIMRRWRELALQSAGGIAERIPPS